MTFKIFGLKVHFLNTRTICNFENHTRSHQLVYEWGGIDAMAGMGWDGVSKVSFNFIYSLCVYRSCRYPLIYM